MLVATLTLDPTLLAHGLVYFKPHAQVGALNRVAIDGTATLDDQRCAAGEFAPFVALV